MVLQNPGHCERAGKFRKFEQKNNPQFAPCFVRLRSMFCPPSQPNACSPSAPIHYQPNPFTPFSFSSSFTGSSLADLHGFPFPFALPSQEEKPGPLESEAVGPTISVRAREQIMSSERDWADLPPELIHLISQKLPDLRYFIRCGAVCKRWFSSIILSDPPQQQLPWLIEYNEQFPKASPLKRELQFYSFVSGEAGSIPIQESHRGKVYHRPGHSYLLVVDGEVISLLNPLTNEEISLPQLPSRPIFIRPVFGGAESSRNWQWDIALVSDEGRWRYVTYHPDKMGWQYVDNLSFKTCYCNGMICTTMNDGRTLVFDVASRKKLYTIPPPNDDPFTNSYVIESCGEILGVSLEYKYGRSQRIVPSFNFRIYMLNLEGERRHPCWVKMSNIRDQIVFLDYYNGFVVRATGGLKGNCIYFILENLPSVLFNNVSKLWRYDIATGTSEPVPCPFERCTWFVPNLR